MVCNHCGANEATIHLTEIINNQMLEIHLCETCAQEKGTDFKTHFNLEDLLAGLAVTEKPSKGSEKKVSLQCPECGMTYEEFARAGRLGCAGCYSALTKMLTPLIKRIQRAVNHLGKRPSKVSRVSTGNQDLRLLQERLRKSIQREAFEEAARLRDEIQQMEEKIKKGKQNKNE